MKTKCSIGLVLLVAASAFAQQGGDRQSEAYRASVAQETLKTDTAAVQAQLAEVAEAMRQLLPGDVGAVDRALKQMDNLSRGEMETTIQALREASRSTDRNAQVARFSSALKSQTKISSVLKQLAIDLDARQSLEALGTELSALVRRQVAAQADVARLGKVQALPKDLRNKHKQTYDAVNDDQKGLTADVTALATRLETLAANAPEESKQRLLRATSVARDRKLVESEQNAAKLTNDGPLPSAADLQDECVKTLVQMEQVFAGTNPLERVAALNGELKKVVDQQQALSTQISAIGEKKSVPDDLKRLAAGLGDQAAGLRAELQPLNSNAANNLQKAQENVDKALENYTHMWEERVDAAANTKAALGEMQAAAKALDQQIAQGAAAAPANPDDLAAKLAALRRDTEQAANTQSRVQPGAAPPFGLTPAQGEALQQQVGDLQQRALPIAPDAAVEIGNAVGEMAVQTVESQRAATDSLRRAVALLTAKENALAGKSPEQQALTKAENQIAQAAQTTAQAQQDMQKGQDLSKAFNDLGAAQQQANAAAQAAATAGAPDAAQQAMQQAMQALADAQKGTAQGDAAQAQTAAQTAQQALAQAKAELGGAKDALAQKAGGPMASKAGNGVGKPQEGGVEAGQGNGGGGKTGDFLKGAGDAGGPAQIVTGLNAHDRDAVSQLQNEKPPSQYVAEVQQYYKNIADGVAP